MSAAIGRIYTIRPETADYIQNPLLVFVVDLSYCLLYMRSPTNRGNWVWALANQQWLTGSSCSRHGRRLNESVVRYRLHNSLDTRSVIVLPTASVAWLGNTASSSLIVVDASGSGSSSSGSDMQATASQSLLAPLKLRPYGAIQMFVIIIFIPHEVKIPGVKN